MTVNAFDSDLAQLQNQLAQAIVTGHESPELMQSLHPCGNFLSATAALNIYKGGYPARLIDSLASTYEAIHKILGDELFFILCRRFISTHPSQSYNLSDYGSQLSIFLESETMLKEKFPFLPELANFEWHFQHTFHLKPDPLISLPEDRLRAVNGLSVLAFTPTLQLFSFTHATYSVWKARHGSDCLPNFRYREFLLMYKVDSHLIKTLLISEPQMQILNRLMQGMTVEQSLVADEGAEDLNEQAITALFSLLISHHLINEIKAG